jgi:hypothetical protein
MDISGFARYNQFKFEDMKKITVILNPANVKDARKHLDTLNGKFLLPNVYRIEVATEEIEATINGLDYILAGIDFNVIINETFNKN